MTHLEANLHGHTLNYAWQLKDVGPADGGFGLIPGSHKMLYPAPRPEHTSIDLSNVKHLEATAGDIVIYLNGPAHCVFGWTGTTERRAVMSKCFPRLHPNDTMPESKL